MFSKLVGFITDGASVMTEKHNGAVKQMLNAQAEPAPSKCEAVGVHCAAHKLRRLCPAIVTVWYRVKEPSATR